MHCRAGFSTAEHSTAEHSAARHSAAQQGTEQYSTAQHSPAQHGMARHSTARHGTAQHTAALHNAQQHSTWQYSTAHSSTAHHSKTESPDSSCQATKHATQGGPHTKAECKVHHTHERHVPMLSQTRDLDFGGKHICAILTLMPPVMPVAMERLLDCLSQTMLQQCPGRSQQQL